MPLVIRIMHTREGQPETGSPKINFLTMINTIIRKAITQNRIPTKEAISSGAVEKAVIPSMEYTSSFQKFHLVSPLARSTFSYSSHLVRKPTQLICVIPNAVNLRQGGAKNVGLKNAEGEWIGFIDSDDWVSPDYYEKLLKKAEETGADLVGCDYSLVDHHTFTVGKVIVNNTPDQTGELMEEQHKSLFIRPGSMVLKIYKHSVIRENRLDFPEHIFYEDNCAGPLWSLYFRHFARVEEPLYYYYQHAVSTVHHITEEKCRDRMKAAELLYTECERRGFLTEYSREIEYRYTELYYVITLFSYMGGVTHPKLAFIRQLRKGVEERFPEFAQNPYYLERTGAPEQKLIRMQSRSDLLFFVYYRMKQWIWKKRGNL